MHFASDNTAGAHPQVLKALVAANSGPVPAYGDDPYTDQLTQRLRTLFEHQDLVAFPVATGSAGNALALATPLPPRGARFIVTIWPISMWMNAPPLRLPILG